MFSIRTFRPVDASLVSSLRLAGLFALAKLVLQFALTLWTEHLGYGYFRDEFYYIACGHHLAWGFVDHGPVVAIQARLGELLFGDSVFAIRIFSAGAGAVMVFLTGLIAWALGGRRPAQALAMFGIICAPQFLETDGYLSMNSFEPVFWMLCVLAILRLQVPRAYEDVASSALRSTPRRSEPLWWSVFGMSAGLGLLNKPSMTFFLLAVGLGLVSTRQRRVLFGRWTAVGLTLMVVLALPNLLWQVHNGWPTLEFLRNGQIGHKTVILNLWQFFLAQFNNMQPVNALIWVTGVVALLRGQSIRHARWLGLAYLFFLGIMLALHAKDYYLAAIYPALFAAGGVAWEYHFPRSLRVSKNRVVAFPILEAVLLLTSMLVLPMASPVLRPAAWIRYTHALHLRGDATEVLATGPLPQFYADRFGWTGEVATVVRTFDQLSPEDQRRVCIFGNNYGEAAAIDFLAPRMFHAALPPAISGQNNYYLWGTHGCDPNISIAVIHDTPEEIALKYKSAVIVGRMDNPYSMPFEHKNIYLLRGRRDSAPFHWRDERFYF